VDAIAGQLGLSLRRHPVQPPCWQDAVDQWFERSRLTGGENFHQAVLGRALVDAMNPPAGLPHWEAAAAAIPSPPASVAHGVILRGLGATLAACGERKQGHHHLVQALLVFRAHSSKHEEAMCLCDIGQNHADAGVFQAALPAFLDGFEIARSIGNLSLMARHSLGVGGCYGSLNDARQAVGWLDKAVGFAEAAGDKTAEGTALVNAAIVHSEVGDHKSAQDRYDKGIHILEAAVGLDNALIRAAKRAFRSKT
jgi:tetratricopeptide (TPR) repeat protein